MCHLGFYPWIEDIQDSIRKKADDEEVQNIYRTLEIDAMYVLWITLGIRIILMFAYLASFKLSKSFLYIEGIYLLFLASIPMKIDSERHSFAFVSMVLWLFAYYIDFFASWLFLNVISVTIYFVIFPLVYDYEG